MHRVSALAIMAYVCAIGAGTGETYSAAERRHWAFQPRTHSPVPTFSAATDRRWIRNPIDAFILARLRKEDLKPAPPASRQTLIRRVYFDLTGLPPTPEQVQ